MKTLLELTKKLSDATLYCENAYFDDDETFGPSDSAGFTISFLKAEAVYNSAYAAYKLAYDSANDNDRDLSDAFTAAVEGEQK